MYITAFNVFNIVSNFTKWIEFSLSLSELTGHRNPTLPRIPSTYFSRGNTFTFVAHNKLVYQLELTRYNASNDASLKERRPTAALRGIELTKNVVVGVAQERGGERIARSLMNPLYREKCSSRFNFLATDDGENFSSISLIYLSLLLRKGTGASPSYILNNIPPLIQQQLAKIN